MKTFTIDLKDDNGKPLNPDDVVRITNDGYNITVELEWDRGVFGFRTEDGKNLIPIAWHLGYSKVEKINK